MRKYAVAALVLAGSLLCGGGSAAEGTPAADLDPVLKKLGILVGGKWVTERKSPSGVPFAETSWTWAPDGKSLIASGIIGQGTAKPVHGTARIGWDPVAKKVYYLDNHGSETVYFGHVRLEGEELVFEFKTIVGTPGDWMIRESYPDRDTMKSRFQRVVDGKPSGEPFNIDFKRVP